MRRVYTLYLQKILVGGAPSELLTFAYDLRRLVPVSSRGKHFFLKSEVHSSDFGNISHAGLAVSIDLPHSYNKSFPQQQYLMIGVAEPRVCDYMNAALCYSYSESSCKRRMIEYPEIDTIRILVESVNANNLQVNGELNITLIFEEMGE